MATETKTKIKELSASFEKAATATLHATKENGQKWQKLTGKLIKKSEPIRQKQKSLVLETAEAVKTQFTEGSEKALDLVGIDAKVIERASEIVKNNPVSKRIAETTEMLKEKAQQNEVVKKVEAKATVLKTKGSEKIEQIKDQLLDQAQKVLDKGDALIEEARKPKAAPKKPVAKKLVTKKPVAKKQTVAAPKTTARKAAAPKKTTPKAKAKSTAKTSTAKDGK